MTVSGYLANRYTSRDKEKADSPKGPLKEFVVTQVPAEEGDVADAPLRIDLANLDRQRVALVGLTLAYDGKGKGFFGRGEADLVKELEERRDQIREIVVLSISDKTYEELATAEGKINLKRELVRKINALLIKGRIEDVYFRQLILA
jgi:flagellar basal body-associated protein FliL